MWQMPEIDGETLAFLQYTSGSTGDLKGVMLTHRNLLHNSALIQAAFGHDKNARGVIWLPPFHDMGLIGGILQPLYSNIPVTLMAPVSFLQRPLRWLQAISHFCATSSGGPNFAYDLCVRKITPEQRVGLDLSSWEVVETYGTISYIEDVKAEGYIWHVYQVNDGRKFVCMGDAPIINEPNSYFVYSLAFGKQTPRF